MPRHNFDQALNTLRDEVLTLGSLVESNLRASADAICRRDQALSRQLIHDDEHVNAVRIRLALQSLSLIATQQPLAGDLRTIATVLAVISELERIHDYVKGIGQITLMLGQNNDLDDLFEPINMMASQAADMLHEALAAFARRDAKLALAIPMQDDAVDAEFNAAYHAIVHFAAEHPNAIERANKLEWVLHNLERSADRAVNICEWIVYMTTGVYREFKSEIEAPPD